MEDIAVLRELYESRRLDEAWAEYERLRGEGPVSPEGHFLGAQSAYKTNRPRDARAAVDRALTGNPTGAVLAKVRFTSGILAREAGDLELAIDELTSCLRELDSLPDLSSILTGAALYNRGLANQLRRRLAEALIDYEGAIREFSRTNMDDYRRQALQNAAWLCAELGDMSQAWTYLAEAEPLFTTAAGHWSHRVTTAYLHCRERDWTQTARLCEWILRDPHISPVEAQSLAASVAAEAFLQQGHLEQADVMGAHAVELSLNSADQMCFSLAQRIHTQIRRTRAGAG